MDYSGEDIINKLKVNKKIVLSQGRYILSKPLEIEEEFEIVGEGEVVIEGRINVYGDGKFKNLIFESDEEEVAIISIKKKSYVKFYKCTLVGVGKNSVGIYLFPNMRSKIYLEENHFEFLNVAISLNLKNLLDELKNCVFSFVKYGVKSLVDGEYLNLEGIQGNEFYDLDGIFISINNKTKISSEEKSVECSLYELSLSNNCGRVKGCKDEISIDTRLWIIYEDIELEHALEVCENGAIIKLKSNDYKGNKIINKTVVLMGEDGVVFKNRSEKQASASFIINADNIYIKDITIDGGGEISFRDGIKFGNRGGKNTKIENVKILRVERRGISIWGEETNKTEIINCLIEDVIYQSGVHTKGDVNITEVCFKNINWAIDVNVDGTVRIENCYFENVIAAVSLKKQLFNNVETNLLHLDNTKIMTYLK